MSSSDFLFIDRADAGQQLAASLASVNRDPQAVVLALPRGGVPVGAALAQSLGLPLEPLIVRKLGLPHWPEYALGALASGGQSVVDRELQQRLHVSDAALEEVIQRERAELVRREQRYPSSVPISALRGRSLILVDDGMATGSTMLAAIAALHAIEAGPLTVAVPVAARDAADKVAGTGARVMALSCPEPFSSVGQWYRDFRQLDDDEVRDVLARARRLPALKTSPDSTPLR
jgi:predicted phosphoribosyltransferase